MTRRILLLTAITCALLVLLACVTHVRYAVTPSGIQVPTGIPVRLRIPRLALDSNIERVGMTADKAMGTPKQTQNVGWFAPGTVPGRTGNAVMTGHLDTQAGEPAVFWNLHQLMAGDDVYVDDADGRTVHFRVTAATSYPADAVPMQTIFGSATGSHLNLITCEGVWNARQKLYDRRLVVFTERMP